MNNRPTISERNAANSRAALDQFARAVVDKSLVIARPSFFYPIQRNRIEAREVFSRGVLLELLGTK